MKKEITPNSPVSALSGVAEGGTREKQLHKLGIFTVGELLMHYPRSYQDRGEIGNISDDPDGLPHSYVLTVVTMPKISMPKRGMTILKFRASDDSGSCEVGFFNQHYLKNSFPVGSRFRFYGKTTRERGGIKLYSPIAEPLGAELLDLYPVYKRTDGLSAKMLTTLLKKAYDALIPTMRDHLPEKIRAERELSTLKFAYKNIHFPESRDSLERARKRLVYDEFFFFAARLRLAREERIRETAPVFEKVDITPFQNAFPYELTGAQKRAIADIERDLTKTDESGGNIPMCRIVVGDVGCGKTAVAAAAAYITVKNRRQCVLMAPTEILARQHYADLSKLLSPLGVKTALLVGSMKAAEKRETLARCADGGADLVIGTHALIEDKVTFSSLGLVITDEQHRFGAMQRARLSDKGGAGTHTLVMSATPIPRTLSLVMYGDLDLSLIDEMPPGRQSVDTFAVDEGYRPRLNAFIRKHVDDGHQVYIVCPAVGGDGDGEEDDEYRDPDAPTLTAATEYAKELSENIFPDIKIGFVHGKMKGAEKDAVMSSFSSGETKILVSTTVIEVGVNVPNATLMIVENAERFGLSQLHQLRGRVGRSSRRAYAYFTYPKGRVISEISQKRLEAIREYAEFGAGFRIALRDMEIRGAGNILGAEQHGHLEAIGYDLYIKLLNDAVLEEKGEVPKERGDCVVSLRHDAHLPDSYVKYPGQRMTLYKRIALIRNEYDADDIIDELWDRFGEMPRAAMNLLDIALIRARAIDLGIKQITETGGEIRMYQTELDIPMWQEMSFFVGGRLKVILGTVGDSYITLKLKPGENSLKIINKMFENYLETVQTIEKNSDEI